MLNQFWGGCSRCKCPKLLIHALYDEVGEDLYCGYYEFLRWTVNK